VGVEPHDVSEKENKLKDIVLRSDVYRRQVVKLVMVVDTSHFVTIVAVAPGNMETSRAVFTAPA
jgi:hypothetical protein